MENPLNIDDLGGKPTIFGNAHMFTLRTPNCTCCCFVGAVEFLMTSLHFTVLYYDGGEEFLNNKL